MTLQWPAFDEQIRLSVASHRICIHLFCITNSCYIIKYNQVRINIHGRASLQLSMRHRLLYVRCVRTISPSILEEEMTWRNLCRAKTQGQSYRCKEEWRTGQVDKEEWRRGQVDKEERRTGQVDKEEWCRGQVDKEERRTGQVDKEEWCRGQVDKEERRTGQVDKEECRTGKVDNE